MPLFVVARTDTVRIFAEVPEVDALLVRKGVRVRIRKTAAGFDVTARGRTSRVPAEKLARIIRDHGRGVIGDGSVGAVETALEESYTQRLW